MPSKQHEILTEIREFRSEQKELKSWLYGADGHVGDVPEIRKALANHNRRIRRLEIVLAGLIGSGALSGGILGLIKWLVG